MGQTAAHQKFDLEYEQINNNYRLLADVRFKLLALVPTLGGTAVFILGHLGLEAGAAPTFPRPELLAVLLVSLLGFFATLGICLYDQRNSELYNALIHRAQHLEKEFGIPSTPGGLRQTLTGGQFSERPDKSRILIFHAGHDLGLALIYGPLLGAWCFPVSYAAIRLSGTGDTRSQIVSTIVTLLAATAFTWRLVILDKREFELYRAAAKRDVLKDQLEEKFPR